MFTRESLWVRREVNPSAALRLICLPFGGGGASAFQPLARVMPRRVEVLAVQLPGREDRFWEPAPGDVAPLVRACAVALRPYCAGPFAVYGHCAGALLGYEVVRHLGERYGLRPRHFVAGARAAPHLPGPEPRLEGLSDTEVVAVMRDWGGVPEEVQRNPGLLASLLPMLRSDFQMWQDYRVRHRAPLECDLTVLRGADDPLLRPELTAPWREYTTGTYAEQSVAGGHFFVGDSPEAGAEALARALDPD